MINMNVLSSNSYINFDYHGINRVVKLSQNFNLGDSLLYGLDLEDDEQYKSFKVQEIQNASLLKSHKESMPAWVKNNLDRVPENTLWHEWRLLGEDDQILELHRLIKLSEITLTKPIPTIMNNNMGMGVLLTNGSKKTNLVLNDVRVIGAALTLDGIPYSCPISFIKAIQDKLGL